MYVCTVCSCVRACACVGESVLCASERDHVYYLCMVIGIVHVFEILRVRSSNDITH